MTRARLLLRLDAGTGAGRADPAADWIALADAAWRAGCGTVLLPAGAGLPDPWLVAAVLVDALPHVQVMVSVQPGAILPVAAAHRAQSLQSLSGARVLLACEAEGTEGADPYANRPVPLNRDQRLARGIEFVAILRALWRDAEPLTFHGHYYRVEQARLPDLTPQRPPLYWASRTRASFALAAAHCDGAIVAAEPHDAAVAAAALERVARARGLRPSGPAADAFRQALALAEPAAAPGAAPYIVPPAGLAPPGHATP